MDSALFFHSDEARQAMRDIVENLPSDVEVYIVGGAVRNALIHKYHGEQWRQRDYDQIVTRNSSKYLEYIESKGFKLGDLDRPGHKAYAKPVVENAQEISYVDNLVFDIHMVDGTTIDENLRGSTGLSINGFALSMRDIFQTDWVDRLYQLPGALQTIKDKEIRVNPEGYASEANYFFACLRFIGAGFQAPPLSEMRQLLIELGKLEPERYQRNLLKLADYVGGQEKARQIVADSFGDEFDIYDEAATRQYIATLK